MSAELINFLKAQAVAAAHAIHEQMSGEILIFDDSKAISQSVGAVYGLVVELNDQELAALIGELPRRKKPRVHAPLFGSFYPLYWGKDMNPGSRIRAHVQNHASTGNARLETYAGLRGKPIQYAAVWVSGYEDFESRLHASFPPILGQGRRGKTSDLVSVLA